MKLYQVSSHAMGGQLVTTGGSQVFAFTARADALRKFKTEKARMDKLDIEYVCTFYEVEVPDRVTLTQWIEYLENGYHDDVQHTIIERHHHQVKKVA